MKPLSKLMLWLIGISVGALIVILNVSPTGWILRRELAAFVMPWGWADDQSFVRQTKEAAERLPTDIGVQIWHAKNINATSGAFGYPGYIDRRPTAFEVLEKRFPDSPAVFANEIRADFLTGFPEVDQSEEAWERAGMPPEAPYQTYQPNASEERFRQDRISDEIRAAAIGERIDPGNAYFPVAMAAAYIGRGQDSLAIACLQRAESDDDWREYIEDDTYGGWRSVSLVDGGIDGAECTQICSGELLPEYAKLREVARRATWDAWKIERSGDLTRGLAIRHSIMHLGSVMRAKSTFYIGSLVGSSIFRCALSRPGGGYLVQVINESDGHGNLNSIVLGEYVSLLRSRGRSDEARWVSLNDQACQQIATPYQFSFDVPWQPRMKELVLDSCWIAAAWILLSCALSALVVSIAAHLCIALSGRIDNRFGQIILTGFSCVLAVGLIVKICLSCESTLTAVLNLYLTLKSSYGPITLTKYQTIEIHALAGIPVFAMLILLVLLVFNRRSNAFLSLLNKVALSSVAVSCLLFLLFCAAAVMQSREDRSFKQQYIDSFTNGEGAYIAKLTGKSWPGLYVEPKTDTLPPESESVAPH